MWFHEACGQNRPFDCFCPSQQTETPKGTNIQKTDRAQGPALAVLGTSRWMAVQMIWPCTPASGLHHSVGTRTTPRRGGRALPTLRQRSDGGQTEVIRKAGMLLPASGKKSGNGSRIMVIIRGFTYPGGFYPLFHSGKLRSFNLSLACSGLSAAGGLGCAPAARSIQHVGRPAAGGQAPASQGRMVTVAAQQPMAGRDGRRREEEGLWTPPGVGRRGLFLFRVSNPKFPYV